MVRRRIWDTLQRRLAGPDDFRLVEGPVLERTVLPFRSFVQASMRHGHLLLAGDAAHTVPPTGAKGLNLALADVRVLAETIERALGKDDLDHLDDYEPQAVARVWKAQHFSFWMISMLHTQRSEDDGRSDDFDEQRRVDVPGRGLHRLARLSLVQIGERYHVDWDAQTVIVEGLDGAERTHTSKPVGNDSIVRMCGSTANPRR